MQEKTSMRTGMQQIGAWCIYEKLIVDQCGWMGNEG